MKGSVTFKSMDSGTHVNPWLIHVYVWQKPLQYCKVVSLQLIKVKGKKKNNGKQKNKKVEAKKKKKSMDSDATLGLCDFGQVN